MLCRPQTTLVDRHDPCRRCGAVELGRGEEPQHIAETSCEQHNDFLDRALVVPTVDHLGIEFFPFPKT